MKYSCSVKIVSGNPQPCQQTIINKLNSYGCFVCLLWWYVDVDLVQPPTFLPSLLIAEQSITRERQLNLNNVSEWLQGKSGNCAINGHHVLASPYLVRSFGNLDILILDNVLQIEISQTSSCEAILIWF